MAIRLEGAQGYLQPNFDRARRRAATLFEYSYLRREKLPKAIGGPPIEHPVYDPTLERFEQSSTRFWQNFAEKKRLLDAGDPAHNDIRIGLVVGGGGMAGIGTAAMLEVLREKDIVNVFDDIIGVSAGAINAACTLSETSAGSHTYLEKFASKDFLRHGLWWPGGMNIQYLDTFLRSEEGLVPRKIREARPNFHIGTVDEHGNRILYDTATLNDEQMYHVGLASMNAPYASKLKSFVKGMFRSDGYLKGFPLEEVLAMGCDNVLVLSSYPVDTILGERNYSPLERLWIRARTLDMPRSIIDATIQKPDATAGSLQPILDNVANFALAAPTTLHVDMITTDPTLLIKAAMEGRNVLTRMLEHVALGEQQTAA